MLRRPRYLLLCAKKSESEKLKPFQNPSRGADASPLQPFAGRWSFCPISGCVRRPLEGDARGGPRLATVLVGRYAPAPEKLLHRGK
jgi:hypothetical protein